MSGKDRSSGLAYYLPEPAKNRTVLHVPGSHILYIGPSGCMRRHALHALEYGDRKLCSFLLISEVDVISGDYEKLVGDAVEELLAVQQPVPRVLFLNVFCIDNFLGTDEDALLSRLAGRFPGRRFVMEHIDPVSLDEKLTMAGKKQANLYSLLEPVAVHDSGVNFLGNFVSLDPACELLALLESWGVSPIRELFCCQTYEEYQDMARSRLAIVLRFMGIDAAVDMYNRLGIPFVDLPTEYDVDRVIRSYESIAAMLGMPTPDFSSEREHVLRDVGEALKATGDTPIALDSSAAMRPFAAARALLNYGFRVTKLFRSPHLFDADREDALYLAAKHPDVQVYRSESYANLLLTGQDRACIAIGADCARLLRARHFVDIWHDEGFFGFHGIRRLMALIREASRAETDWPDLAMPGKE
jgi:hypothetical protein